MFTFAVLGCVIGITLGLVAWLAKLWRAGSVLAAPATVVAAGVVGLSTFLGLAEDDIAIWLILGLPAAAACGLLAATVWRLAVYVADAAR